MANGGYKVRVKAFVPVDGNDADEQIAVLQAIKAAKGGDVKALGELLAREGVRFDELDTKAVSSSTAPGTRKRS